jgi:hypothetical protein
MLTVLPHACIRLLGSLFRRAEAGLLRGAALNAVIDVASWDAQRLDVGLTLRDLRRLHTARADQQSDIAPTAT